VTLEELKSAGFRLRKIVKGDHTYLCSLPTVIVETMLKPSEDGSYYVEVQSVADGEIRLTQPWVVLAEVPVSPKEQTVHDDTRPQSGDHEAR